MALRSVSYDTDTLNGFSGNSPITFAHVGSGDLLGAVIQTHGYEAGMTVKYGGVAGTLLDSFTSNGTGAFWSVTSPTDGLPAGSQNVEVAWDTDTVSSVQVGVITLNNVKQNKLDRNVQSATFGDTDVTAPTESEDVVVAVHWHSNDPSRSAVSWSNATERYDGGAGKKQTSAATAPGTGSNVTAKVSSGSPNEYQWIGAVTVQAQQIVGNQILTVF